MSESSIELPISYDFGDATDQLGRFGAGIEALVPKAQAATAALSGLVNVLTAGQGLSAASGSLATFNVKIDQSSKSITDNRQIVQTWNKTVNDTDNSVTNITNNVTKMGAAAAATGQQVQQTSAALGTLNQAMERSLSSRLVSGELSRIASSYQGLGKTVSDAASQMARGFLTGGPWGAALAAASIGLEQIGQYAKQQEKDFQEAMKKEAESQRQVIASYEQLRQKLEQVKLERAALTLQEQNPNEGSAVNRAQAELNAAQQKLTQLKEDIRSAAADKQNTETQLASYRAQIAAQVTYSYSTVSAQEKVINQYKALSAEAQHRLDAEIAISGQLQLEADLAQMQLDLAKQREVDAEEKAQAEAVRQANQANAAAHLAATTGMSSALAQQTEEVSRLSAAYKAYLVTGQSTIATLHSLTAINDALTAAQKKLATTTFNENQAAEEKLDAAQRAHKATVEALSLEYGSHYPASIAQAQAQVDQLRKYVGETTDAHVQHLRQLQLQEAQLKLSEAATKEYDAALQQHDQLVKQLAADSAARQLEEQGYSSAVAHAMAQKQADETALANAKNTYEAKALLLKVDGDQLQIDKAIGEERDKALQKAKEQYQSIEQQIAAQRLLQQNGGAEPTDLAKAQAELQALRARREEIEKIQGVSVYTAQLINAQAAVELANERAKTKAMTEEAKAFDNAQKARLKAAAEAIAADLQDNAGASSALAKKAAAYELEAANLGLLTKDTAAYAAELMKVEALKREMMTQAAQDEKKQQDEEAKKLAAIDKEHGYLKALGDVGSMAWGQIGNAIGSAFDQLGTFSQAQQKLTGLQKQSAAEATAAEEAKAQAMLAALAKEATMKAIMFGAEGIVDVLTPGAEPKGIAELTAAGILASVAGGSALGAYAIGSSRGNTAQENSELRQYVGGSGGGSTGSSSSALSGGGGGGGGSGGGGTNITIISGQGFFMSQSDLQRAAWQAAVTAQAMQ